MYFLTVLLCKGLYPHTDNGPPPVFISFFTKITQIHSYNTRFAAKQSNIIFQKQKQIMEYSVLDFKVHQYGTPLMKILNHLCLYLKRK